MPQITLTATWGADVNASQKFPGDGSDFCGVDLGVVYRVVNKFDISTLPATAVVTQVELLIGVNGAGGSSSTWDIDGYNGTGLGDPQTDTTTDTFNGCNVAGVYVDDLTDFRSTGLKTLVFSSQANADVEAARDAGTIFSVAIRETDESTGRGNTRASLAEYDDVTDPPKLRITYTEGTVEQHSFRFGADDGGESGHTWLAAENTNVTHPLNTNLLYRALLDASTGDPPARAFTLRYQKNGAGGYQVVPVGSGSTTSPPAAPSATVTTVGTAATTWNINRPTASSGDMVVFVIAWDDSTDVTTVTAPSGPNSETAVSIAGPVASASTEMRMQAWYYIATGTWTTGTLAFTPSASETCRAVAFVIPSGQFNASDPIGFANTRASAGTNETTLRSPTGTAESNDGDGRLYIGFGSDVDAITAPGSDWNTINNATGGGVGLCVGSRNTLVTNNESIAEITATIAGDSWASLCFVVKPFTTTNELYVALSSNIAAGGEATTARMTSPSGKTTADFVTGRRWDDENGTDTIDITSLDYTEVEICLRAQSPAQNNDYFDLRWYAGSDPLSVYSQTGRWTIGTGGPPPMNPALLGKQATILRKRTLQ